MAREAIPNITGEYDPEEDSRTLTEAEAIRSDPDRHKAAMSHLADKAQHMKNAYLTSRQQLEKQTSKRMKQVFGEHAPFEEAEGEQETPFTRAAGSQAE